MRRSSASCNQLASLNNDGSQTKQALLPICESSPCLHHHDDDNLEVTKLRLSHDDEEPLLLPKDTSTTSIDEYLSTIPRVASRSKELLSKKDDESHSFPQLLQDTRCLNVLQGEMAHASASQADVMVSADATTCHIVAIRSTTRCAEALVSLAHIDKVGYDACLASMVKKHVNHHHSSQRKVNKQESDADEYGYFWDDDENDDSKTKDDTESSSFLPLSVEGDEEGEAHNDVHLGEMIDMEVHMLGGFLDDHGTSQQLSNALLKAFSKLAERHDDLVRMRISTAAISCMNHCNGEEAPVGRGMGIYIATGKVFLCNSIPVEVAGPALSVRSARAFSSSNNQTLQVIHDTETNELVIEPFEYEPFKEVDILLRLPNETLLQYTSTSPKCEADGFCDNLRSTLGFIKRVPSCEVFGNLCDKPLVYSRSKSTAMLNEWALRT